MLTLTSSLNRFEVICVPAITMSLENDLRFAERCGIWHKSGESCSSKARKASDLEAIEAEHEAIRKLRRVPLDVLESYEHVHQKHATRTIPNRKFQCMHCDIRDHTVIGEDRGMLPNRHLTITPAPIGGCTLPCHKSHLTGESKCPTAGLEGTRMHPYCVLKYGGPKCVTAEGHLLCANCGEQAEANRSKAF